MPPLFRRRARRGTFLGRNWSANLTGMLTPEEVIYRTNLPNENPVVVANGIRHLSLLSKAGIIPYGTLRLFRRTSTLVGHTRAH
jgi:hypothetical protein